MRLSRGEDGIVEVGWLVCMRDLGAFVGYTNAPSISSRTHSCGPTVGHSTPRIVPSGSRSIVGA